MQDEVPRKPAAEHQHFTLYVAGASALSSRAIVNIQQFIAKELNGEASLQIVDVHQQQQTASAQQLIALPMLVRTLPLPERKFIGDLSDLHRLKQAIAPGHL